MAIAEAKFTSELGVCLSTGGPGATHLITGLYDAKLDHVPVLQSAVKLKRPSAEPAISRNSTSTACSRTLQASYKRPRRQFKCGIFWTAA
jgi:Thiamine pyrophosphate enzyme, N-terminal TPP binding domain